MRFVPPSKNARAGGLFVFQLTEHERDLLLTVLRAYPLVDANHHKLSRNPKATTKAEQEWLVETLGQQQAEHRKKLDQLFTDSRRYFKEVRGEFLLTLNGEQMEWLLRVLNDIRVGTWERLGCPELEVARHLKATGAQARLLASMEYSGYFQSILLQAFS